MSGAFPAVRHGCSREHNPERKRNTRSSSIQHITGSPEAERAGNRVQEDGRVVEGDLTEPARQLVWDLTLESQKVIRMSDRGGDLVCISETK